MADVTGRMKYGVSLIDGLLLRPHLRKLILNHITDQFYKEGKTITIPWGAPLRQLSTWRRLAECNLLEGSDINQLDTSQKAREALWASYDERRRGIKRDRGVGFTAPVDRALAELTSALYTMTPVSEEEPVLEDLDSS